ncbi:DUF2891 domain-containing protein [Flagellimonas sp. S174]|uniref:DUF2891 domain-containing protein n=1 Tax=Flagellimonas sp. S174 TaxID=3410790 RepID=UPI003BF60D6F
MKHIVSIALSILLLGFFSCKPEKKEPQVSIGSEENPEEIIELTLEQANILATLPVECITKEYPNKLGHVLGGEEDLGSPKTLHPAFYGCFDWHSAVHGHWSLVRLLKTFPDLEEAEKIRQILSENLSQENIATEVAYFDNKHNRNYERTYGWGWLLKLAEELHNFDDPLARELEQNLEPLTQLIAQKFVAYLPKLQYPVRVGTHTNTAFGLAFAWDYAKSLKHQELKDAIQDRALAFYQKDSGCPLAWEPSGADFLSPCFEEIDLMRRILNKEDFLNWINNFMPDLKEISFDLPEAIVGDRKDGQLVHLDGLNFSRAWVLYGLAKQYPDQYSHVLPLAHKHFAYSFPNLVGDDYEGGHWLGSFAIYALGER